MKLFKNQKGFNRIITMFIIACILGAMFIVGVFVRKEVQIVGKDNMPSHKVASIELNWQKYTNSYYGFILRTPLNWPVVSGDLEREGIKGQKIYISGTTNSIGGDQIYIVITPLMEGENEKEAFSRLQDLDANSLTSKDIALGEIQGAVYYGISNPNSIEVVTFVKNNNLYVAYDLKPGDRNSSGNIFLGIISSIKFY